MQKITTEIKKDVQNMFVTEKNSIQEINLMLLTKHKVDPSLIITSQDTFAEKVLKNLGLLFSKEEQKTMTLKLVNELKDIPVTWFGIIPIIDSLSGLLNVDKDNAEKLLKVEWPNDFPKKEKLIWQAPNPDGKSDRAIKGDTVYNVFLSALENPNITMQEFKDEKVKIENKGGYDMDAIKWVNLIKLFISKHDIETFNNLFTK